MDLLNGSLARGGTGQLTERELLLLSYLAERAGQVVSREELIEVAFGYAPNARSRAVDKAMYSLRRKVERDPARPEHLLTCVGVGYQFVPLEALPRQPHPTVPRLVGRDEDLRRLGQWILEGGVTTVRGPPGVGKTQLVASTLVTFLGHDDGVTAWCDVGRPDVEGFARDVAAGLGSHHVEGPPAEHVERVLRAHSPEVVVIDGWTAPRDATRALLERWRTIAPRTAWVCTGPAPIGLDHERVLVLPPLAEKAAMQLFLERARERGYPLEVNEALRTLLQRLDGLPLALELAATRIGAFGVADLAELLEEGIDVLEPLRLRLAARWRELHDHERSVLRHLAACADGADLPMLRRAIGSGPPLRPDTVRALVESSWIQPQHCAERVRLRLLEPIRTFVSSPAIPARW